MKSDRPKVLLEANGLPLLWYSVRAAREAGAGEVVVVVGAGREEVEAAFEGDGLTWALQEEQRGTGHAVRCAREALSGFDGELLVLCGDSPLVRASTLGALVERTRESGAGATILTSIVDEPAGYGRIVRGGRGVERIVEERDADSGTKAIKEINSGTYCFKWPELDAVLDELSDDNAQGELLLTDCVALLIARGARVEALASDDASEGLGVNSREQLAAVSKALRNRVARRWMDEGVTIVDPDTAFIDERAEIGRDTTINPFVVIEGPVKIGAGCRIGPFTHIRGETELAEGVHLGNFVEVKKSTLGDKSRARHLAFIGDAIVGSDVNLAAGVITANSDGRTVHVTKIGDGASIAAGTVLVAPTEVSAQGATGAGAVVLKNANVQAGEIWAGVPARKLKDGGNEDG